MEPNLSDTPSVSPPSACSMPQPLPSPDCEVLDQLLSLARQYLQSDLRRQAMDILWSLLEKHLHTAQALAARSDLLQLAQRYEAEGFTHIARDIFERLLWIEEGASHGKR